MGLGRHVRRAALLAACACPTPAALVAASAARADTMLQPAGSLIYSWHGDPGRGCARVGVCGVQGTLIVTPQGPSFLISPGPGTPMLLDLSQASATVRVRRTEPGSTGDCVDSEAWPNVGQGALNVRLRAGGRALAIIPGPGGPSSGRCAGPRPGDLGAVLSGRGRAGRHPSFTFTGTHAFAAGPYSGMLVSTLTFGPDVAPGSGFSSSSSSSAPTSTPGPRPRMVLFERVQLQIRLNALSGALVTRFAGESDASCMVFDACGTTGSLSLAFGAAQTTITVEASRRVRRRVSRAQALADFRAGRLDAELGALGPNLRASVSETLARAGGVTCVDGPLPQPSVNTFVGSPFQPGTRSVIHVLIVGDAGTPEPLRTRCPGPWGTDVFGADGNGVMARGAVTPTQLLQAHTSVVLGTHGAFAGIGYVGRRTGSVIFRLSLRKIIAGSVREPA